MKNPHLSIKVIKMGVRSGFIVGSILLFLWFVTLKWGSSKLEQQLVLSAKVELQEIDRISRARDPNIPSAEEVFRTKLPIVKVELISIPLPLVFEAQTEVRLLPDSGDVVVAKYLFTPWRIYQLSVKKHLVIIPRTY